ncbi:MAG: hypothetical protein K2F62_00160, partial [Muribaculaceae bacterium]|nr:hypothetical protein [Muribaculaceae bacterium]
ALILAGILTDFYRDYNRNYNWGSGFSIKAEMSMRLPQSRWTFSVANQFYRLYTWQGYDPNTNWSLTPEGKPVNVQGDSGNATFNHFEALVRYRIFTRLHAALGIDVYKRFSFYKDIEHTGPDFRVQGIGIDSKQVGIHLMLTYKI